MKKILLIDDSPDHLELLSLLLEEESYRVLVAHSGVAGLARALVDEVDLIITDLRMPEGDGLWLMTELKVRSLKIPVIVLTAELDKEEEVMALGAQALILKPFRFENLTQTVEHCLTL